MKLFYRKTGKGKPFVILHGLYGSSDNWMGIARLMSDTYSFYLLDQRNHGSSPHSENGTYNDMVSDLHEFILSKNLNDIILLGHSMGGKVAMLFALKYPQLVSKLIVVDVAPKNYLNASNFGTETTNHAHILASLIGIKPALFKTRKQMDDKLKTSIPQPNLRSFLLKNIKRNEDGTFIWRLNLPVLQESINHIMDGFSDAKGQSNVDTLFIKGQYSPYIQVDDHFVINNFFPRSQVVTIPETGHWVHAEQPTLLINTIRYFLG